MIRHFVFAAALVVAAAFPAIAGSDKLPIPVINGPSTSGWVTSNPPMCLMGDNTWASCVEEVQQPDPAAIDYAELHADGAIQVSVFPCGGVRITSHKHTIYDHPAHCAKKRDDD